MSFLNNFNFIKFLKYPKLITNKNLKIKFFILGLNKNAGRNNSGVITMQYRGNGHKRNYRFIDFQRDSLFFWNVPAVVVSIEYDPNRSCFISLILYANGFLSYILSLNNLILGNILSCGASRICFLGDRKPLKFFEVNTKLNNIKYWSRSAGCFSKFLGHLNNLFVISLPSGKKKLVQKDCLATFGVLSNILFYKWKKYKAGQSKWLGKRPHVRGVAKNPIDHPMGGGQGKTSGGRVSVSPWGIYTKGYKTKRKIFEKYKKQSINL